VDSDCHTSAYPVCLANKCVQCLTNSECSSNTSDPVCNIHYNCVECIANPECVNVLN
jgi:hypothetical protein